MRIQALLRTMGEPIPYSRIVCVIGNTGPNATNGLLASTLMEMVKDGAVVTTTDSPRRFTLPNRVE